MSVTSITKDTDARTMTIVSQFPAAVGRVWQLWADPRQLEKWWGPPTYPATVIDHELTPGGSVSYFMTGPEGDKHRGWWRLTAVEAPHRLAFDDGFADDAGEPVASMPTMAIRVELAEAAGVTTMTIETTFPSAEAMAQMIAMGMDEGMASALGQIDDLLLADAGQH